MLDEIETHNIDVYPLKEEKKSNFAFQYARALTFIIGLLISSLIFGFFGVAIGATVDGNNGALIGLIIGLILAAVFSFMMLANKDLHS